MSVQRLITDFNKNVACPLCISSLTLLLGGGLDVLYYVYSNWRKNFGKY